MKPETLYNLLGNPQQLNEATLVELQQIVTQYPYFTTARVLWNFNLARLQNVHTAEHLKQTSIYAGDRTKLFALFHQKPLMGAGSAAQEKSAQKSFRSAIAEKEQLVRKQAPEDATQPEASTTQHTASDVAKTDVAQTDQATNPDNSKASVEAKPKSSQAEEAPQNTQHVEIKNKADLDAILHSKFDLARTGKASFMKVYYAVEAKNVIEFFKRGPYAFSSNAVARTQESLPTEVHQTSASSDAVGADESVEQVSVAPQSAVLTEADVEAFVKQQVQAIRETAPSRTDTAPDDESTDLHPQEMHELGIRAEEFNHEKLINTLIGNLRKARSIAMEQTDDSLAEWVGGYSQKNTTDPYAEVLRETATQPEDLSPTQQSDENQPADRLQAVAAAEQTTQSQDSEHESKIEQEHSSVSPTSEVVADEVNSQQLVDDLMRNIDTSYQWVTGSLLELAILGMQSAKAVHTLPVEPIEIPRAELYLQSLQLSEQDAEQEPVSLVANQQETESESVVVTQHPETQPEHAFEEQQVEQQVVDASPEAASDLSIQAPEKAPVQETTINPNETAAERVLRQIAEKREKLRKEKENANTTPPNTAEKKTTDPQIDQHKQSLIERFIQEQPSIRRDASDVPQGDLLDAIESTRENDALATEPLAKLYIKQKYYAKAIATYQKLSLKSPEKSAYFAEQIEQVKKLMNLE